MSESPERPELARNELLPGCHDYVLGPGAMLVHAPECRCGWRLERDLEELEVRLNHERLERFAEAFGSFDVDLGKGKGV